MWSGLFQGSEIGFFVFAELLSVKERCVLTSQMYTGTGSLELMGLATSINSYYQAAASVLIHRHRVYDEVLKDENKYQFI